MQLPCMNGMTIKLRRVPVGGIAIDLHDGVELVSSIGMHEELFKRQISTLLECEFEE